jgi:Tfp pilus assembly protein PilE
MRNEVGRSLLEMLAVLAIIGALSICGLCGYANCIAKCRSQKVYDRMIEIVDGVYHLYEGKSNFDGISNDVLISSNLFRSNEVDGSKNIIIDLGQISDTGYIPKDSCVGFTYCPHISNSFFIEYNYSNTDDEFICRKMMDLSAISEVKAFQYYHYDLDGNRINSPVFVNDANATNKLPIGKSDAVEFCGQDMTSWNFRYYFSK